MRKQIMIVRSEIGMTFFYDHFPCRSQYDVFTEGDGRARYDGGLHSAGYETMTEAEIKDAIKGILLKHQPDMPDDMVEAITTDILEHYKRLEERANAEAARHAADMQAASPAKPSDKGSAP